MTALRRFILLTTTLAVCAACATSAVARRATAIADADKDAKQALAAEQRLNVASIPATSFAVTPFSVAGVHDSTLTPLGYGLADLLMTDLAVTRQLRMVDRLRIDAVLRELDLARSGALDPNTAPRAGRIIGARRILVGTVSTTAGGAVRLEARVVDVSTSTVQDLVSAEAPLGRIIDAEKALALLLLERLGVTITPAERLRIELKQTTQLAALVAFGRGVEAEARGDAAGAMAGFAEATRLDASFTAARANLAGVPASGSSTTRTSGVQRVLDLSTQALNTAAGRVSEAADTPLAASLTIPIIFTVRVTP